MSAVNLTRGFSTFLAFEVEAEASSTNTSVACDTSPITDLRMSTFLARSVKPISFKVSSSLLYLMTDELDLAGSIGVTDPFIADLTGVKLAVSL